VADFKLTIFPDRFASEADEYKATSEELAELIRKVVRPCKIDLPQVKLGLFGDNPSASESYRYDANLHTITGIEADYDGEEVSFESAVGIAREAGLKALFYTSPSYTREKPRWRMLCPFGEARQPAERDRMMDRANGIFGGIFADESWTLSQGYYIGGIEGEPPPLVEITHGLTIDQLIGLDEKAIGRSRPNGGDGKAPGGPIDEAGLLAAIVAGEKYHSPSISLLGHWAHHGTSMVAANERLFESFDRVSPSLRDKRWHDRRAEIPRMLEYVYGNEAEKRGDGQGKPSNSVAERRFKLVRFKDIKLDKKPRCIVEDLIPREGLVLVWGPPKCGKTFWVVHLAMCIALGREYQGLRVEQGTVVYIAAEGQFGFGARVAAFRESKLTAGADDDPPFLLLPTPLDLVGEIDTLITDIAAQLDRTAPILIVLDTLNRTLVGSESRDQDMSAYIAACDRIRARFKCAVLIVHHCGLNETRPRGHTSATGAADAQIAVSGRDDLIIAKVEFMKDGPDGAVFAGRRVPVEVGVDENGKMITSCVVEDADSSEAQGALAAKAGGRPPRERQLVLKALEKAIGRAGVEFHPSGSSQPVRAVTIDAWRECYYELSPVAGDDNAKKEARKKAFGRAVNALLKAKPPMIGIENEYVWVR
jgi:hypothetical protein